MQTTAILLISIAGMIHKENAVSYTKNHLTTNLNPVKI